jgi:hypothetical protein
MFGSDLPPENVSYSELELCQFIYPNAAMPPMQDDIAELGMFRGLGLMTWANLLESYCIGDRTKIVYGFDNWKGFGKARTSRR